MRNRVGDIADLAKRSGRQVARRDIVRIDRHQPIEFGQRLGHPVLPVEDGREVEARGGKARRQFYRAAEQRFGIDVAPDPPGEFRQHPDRRDVGRLLLQMVFQQPLGHRQIAITQGNRGLAQNWIADRAADLLRIGLVGCGEIVCQDELVAQCPPGLG